MTQPGDAKASQPRKARARKARARKKHVPQRTCVVCRTVHSKRELVRLVRTPEGQLVVDKTGKQNGRGAYLCHERSCWEAARQGRQLGKALKMEMGEREQQVLRDAIELEFDSPQREADL
jgi:predicted RNA-binding protein YlxR (DUF448 family)